MSAVETPPGERHEEPEDRALREKLGIRRHWHASQPDVHPDPNPCPPWCWIVTDYPDGYAHEVDYHRPNRANHRLEPAPTTVASLYRGNLDATPDENRNFYVSSATLDLALTQVSTREPMVTVHLRDYPYNERHKMRYDERLRLIVAHARELITALQYVCDVAEDKP